MTTRRFTVSAPDWGHAHLTPDAVVAFVDDELDRGPHIRAVDHVATCPVCAAEVVAQRRARTALRCATCPSLPTSLMSSLRSIPQDAELPPPPSGLAVTADGELVSLLHSDLIRADPPPRTPSRRLRFGAGAAVSGLAFGAIALGVAVLPADVPAPVTGNNVLRGPVGPAATPARFGLDPASRPTPDVDAPQTFLQHGLR